jgi:hypothetical protein
MKRFLFFIALLLWTFLGFSQSRYVSETTKKIVYTRDGGVCQCCGVSYNLEYDHITPFSCGGSNGPSNIQLLCQSCNRSKSNSCYCKIHNRKVGTNCCDKGSTTRSSSSSSTTATSQQCTGTTKQGARCRLRTTSPSGRCHHHR